MFTALLEKVATTLDRAGIPYTVIGGQAVLRHGEARLTQDIDLTLGVDDIEPRLRRVRGHRELPRLRVALVKELELTSGAEMVA